MNMAKQWLFITGTDTDVGKTVVACGFLAAANQQGLRTAAIKPVAAGCELTEQGMTNSDALQLQAAASHQLSYQQINPIALEPAIAPHIAAAEAGVRLSASRLVGYCRGVSLMPVDLVLIEGFKRDRHPKIEAWRTDAKNPLIAPGDDTIRAVACDAEIDTDGRPRFNLDDTGAIADFIATELGL